MDKRMMAGLVLVVVLIAAASFLTGDTKGIITGDFSNNQAEMTALAQSMLDDKTDKALFDKYSSTYDISVWKTEDVIVQFVAYAEGIAPAGKYVGVYYSPDDVVTTFQGSARTMKITENGAGFDLQEAGSDNGGYTEKISDNWYYFEAWF